MALWHYFLWYPDTLRLAFLLFLSTGGAVVALRSAETIVMALEVQLVTRFELEADAGEHPIFEESEEVAVRVFAASGSTLRRTCHVYRVVRQVSAAAKVSAAHLFIFWPSKMSGVFRNGGGGCQEEWSSQAAVVGCHPYTVGGLDESQDGDHHHLTLPSLAKHGESEVTGLAC